MDWYYDAFRVLSLLVVWAIPAALVVTIIVIAILAPVLTLTGMGINLYQSLLVRPLRKRGAKMPSTSQACATNTDCPPGFICVSGRCVAAKS